MQDEVGSAVLLCNKETLDMLQIDKIINKKSVITNIGLGIYREKCDFYVDCRLCCLYVLYRAKIQIISNNSIKPYEYK